MRSPTAHAGTQRTSSAPALRKSSVSGHLSGSNTHGGGPGKGAEASKFTAYAPSQEPGLEPVGQLPPRVSREQVEAGQFQMP